MPSPIDRLRDELDISVRDITDNTYRLSTTDPDAPAKWGSFLGATTSERDQQTGAAPGTSFQQYYSSHVEPKKQQEDLLLKQIGGGGFRQPTELEMVNAAAEARIADPREQLPTFAGGEPLPSLFDQTLGRAAGAVGRGALGVARANLPVAQRLLSGAEGIGRYGGAMPLGTIVDTPFIGDDIANQFEFLRNYKARRAAQVEIDKEGSFKEKLLREMNIFSTPGSRALADPELRTGDEIIQMPVYLPFVNEGKTPAFHVSGLDALEAIADITNLIGGAGIRTGAKGLVGQLDKPVQRTAREVLKEGGQSIAEEFAPVTRALGKAGDLAADVGAAAERAGIPSPISRASATFDEPFKIPPALGKSRVSPFFGGKQSNIVFDSDFDRALYIATAKGRPKTKGAIANRETIRALVREELQKRGLDPNSMVEIAAPMRRAVQEAAQATDEFDVPFSAFRYAGEAPTAPVARVADEFVTFADEIGGEQVRTPFKVIERLDDGTIRIEDPNRQIQVRSSAQQFGFRESTADEIASFQTKRTRIDDFRASPEGIEQQRLADDIPTEGQATLEGGVVPARTEQDIIDARTTQSGFDLAATGEDAPLRQADAAARAAGDVPTKSAFDAPVGEKVTVFDSAGNPREATVMHRDSTDKRWATVKFEGSDDWITLDDAVTSPGATLVDGRAFYAEDPTTPAYKALLDEQAEYTKIAGRDASLDTAADTEFWNSWRARKDAAAKTGSAADVAPITAAARAADVAPTGRAAARGAGETAAEREDRIYRQNQQDFVESVERRAAREAGEAPPVRQATDTADEAFRAGDEFDEFGSAQEAADANRQQLVELRADPQENPIAEYTNVLAPGSNFFPQEGLTPRQAIRLGNRFGSLPATGTRAKGLTPSQRRAMEAGESVELADSGRGGPFAAYTEKEIRDTAKRIWPTFYDGRPGSLIPIEAIDEIDEAIVAINPERYGGSNGIENVIDDIQEAKAAKNELSEIRRREAVREPRRELSEIRATRGTGTIDEQRTRDIINVETDVAPSQLPELNLDASLPAGLSKSTPKFGKQFLDFESDVDKALYIVGNPKTKSKAHSKFMAWLTDEVGMAESEIIQQGQVMRERVRDFAASGEGTVQVQARRRLPVAQTSVQTDLPVTPRRAPSTAAEAAARPPEGRKPSPADINNENITFLVEDAQRAAFEGDDVGRVLDSTASPVRIEDTPLPSSALDAFGFSGISMEPGLTTAQRWVNVIKRALQQRENKAVKDVGDVLGVEADRIADPVNNVVVTLRQNATALRNTILGQYMPRINKVFDISADQTIAALKGVDETLVLKSAGADTIEYAPTIQDVAARLPKYINSLTPDQIAVLRDLSKQLEPMGDALRATGDEFGVRKDIIVVMKEDPANPGKFIADTDKSGFYIPRGSQVFIDPDSAYDLPLPFVGDAQKGMRPSQELEAKFTSMAENIAAGNTYDSLETSIGSLITRTGERIADTFVSETYKVATDEFGQKLGLTRKELMKRDYPDLDLRMESLKTQLRQLKQLIGSKRVQTEKVVESFLNDPYMDSLSDLQKALIAATKAQRGVRVDQGLRELREGVRQINKQITTLKKVYDPLLASVAKRERRGTIGGALDYPQLNGLTFPERMAARTNQFIKKERGDLAVVARGVALVDRVQRLWKASNATLDLSGIGIQALMTSWDNPKRLAIALPRALQALGSPGAYGDWATGFNARAARQGGFTIEEMTGQLGLAQTNEAIDISSGILQSGFGIPKAGNVLGSPFRAADRSFGAVGDIIRAETLYDITMEQLAAGMSKAEIVKTGLGRELGDVSNYSTGYVNGDFTIPNLVMFSGRFFAARLKSLLSGARGIDIDAPLDLLPVVGTKLKRYVPSLNPYARTRDKYARRMILRMYGWGTLLTVAVNTRNGHETDFRLVVDGKFNSNFIRIRGKTRDYSVFGPADSLLRIIVNLGLFRAKDTFEAVTNAPIFNIVSDLYTNEKFGGIPIIDDRIKDPSMEQKAANTARQLQYAFSQTLPFAGDEVGSIIGDAWRDRSDPTAVAEAAMTAAGEVIGAKSSPFSRADIEGLLKDPRRTPEERDHLQDILESRRAEYTKFSDAARQAEVDQIYKDQAAREKARKEANK